MLRSTLSEEQQQSRAKNAVARFLFHELIVPKIFFDARWPSRRGRVDILAIDRAGAGEIHIVDVKLGNLRHEDIRRIAAIPAHFKYLALFGDSSSHASRESLYAPDGMGRIGVIQVREKGADELHVKFEIRPERFRLDSSYYKQVDKFATSYPVDMEIRP
jgi:hypothetical protein